MKNHNKSLQNSSIEEPYFMGKRSRMSATLLSNYVLAISLMKNIAKRFSDPDSFE